MSNLSIFNFQKSTIRVLMDDGNNPLFVAKDVAKALGYKDTANAIKQFCKGAVKHHPLKTEGGTQKLRVIYEPDVYRLIFGSKLEGAVVFQDWVFEEVLPSIRKTGSYTHTLSQGAKDHLSEIVRMRCEGNRGQMAYLWRKHNTHFGIASYHHLPQSKLKDAESFLWNCSLNDLQNEVATFKTSPSYFLHKEHAREFDARMHSLHDLAMLLASEGNKIAKVFQKQARDMNKFLAHCNE